MSRCFVAAVLAFLGAYASSAHAEHSITFYLGAPQTVSGTPVSGFVPDHGYPQPDPGAEATVTVGLWAVPQFDWASPPDIWQGININIVTTGGVTVDSIAINNSNHGSVFAPAYRWEADSDFGTGSSFYLVALYAHGLGGLLPAPYGAPTDDLCYLDGPEGSGVLRYWLGNVTLSAYGGAWGDVFLQIGYGGIARRGGVVAEDLIYFGLDGDAPLHGDQSWAISETPEFTVGIPEPAGLLLLSLAALFLRRR